MGQLQQSIQNEEQKKTALIEYQGEYLQGFQTSAKNGIQGIKLQQFESFILQIDQALIHQKNQVLQYEQQLEKAQDIYKQLNLRLKSFEKLQSRLDEQALKSENRQLQIFLDEIGAQLHSLNKGHLY